MSASPSERPVARKRRREAVDADVVFSALLVGSGFAALIYETLWVKQLGRVAGVEIHAVTIALSAFFAGLALGGALLAWASSLASWGCPRRAVTATSP